MRRLKNAAAALGAALDKRDVMGLIGCVLVCIGGETLHPGAGMAATGAILVAIAVLVR
jgi:hypothetical protein